MGIIDESKKKDLPDDLRRLVKGFEDSGARLLTPEESKKFLESMPSNSELLEDTRKTKKKYDELTEGLNYKWDESWGEISGFMKAGEHMAGYEWCCRFMFLKGLEWLDIHPDAKPKQHSVRHIYGMAFNTNKDAEELESYLIYVAKMLGGGSPSGAQMQAIMRHLGFVAREGFEKWKQEKMKHHEK